MALTDNVKTRSVNVTTGEVTETYYADAEWAAIEAAWEADLLPKARKAAKRAHKAEARALVSAALGDEFTRMKQLTAYARLATKANRSAAESADLADLDVRIAWATAVEAEYNRVKALILAAETAEDLADVEAPNYPTM